MYFSLTLGDFALIILTGLLAIATIIVAAATYLNAAAAKQSADIAARRFEADNLPQIVPKWCGHTYVDGFLHTGVRVKNVSRRPVIIHAFRSSGKYVRTVEAAMLSSEGVFQELEVGEEYTIPIKPIRLTETIFALARKFRMPVAYLTAVVDVSAAGVADTEKTWRFYGMVRWHPSGEFRTQPGSVPAEKNKNDQADVTVAPHLWST